MDASGKQHEAVNQAGTTSDQLRLSRRNQSESLPRTLAKDSLSIALQSLLDKHAEEQPGTESDQRKDQNLSLERLKKAKNPKSEKVKCREPDSTPKSKSKYRESIGFHTKETESKNQHAQKQRVLSLLARGLRNKGYRKSQTVDIQRTRKKEKSKSVMQKLTGAIQKTMGGDNKISGKKILKFLKMPRPKMNDYVDLLKDKATHSEVTMLELAVRQKRSKNKDIVKNIREMENMLRGVEVRHMRQMNERKFSISSGIEDEKSKALKKLLLMRSLNTNTAGLAKKIKAQLLQGQKGAENARKKRALKEKVIKKHQKQAIEQLMKEDMENRKLEVRLEEALKKLQMRLAEIEMEKIVMQQPKNGSLSSVDGSYRGRMTNKGGSSGGMGSYSNFGQTQGTSNNQTSTYQQGTTQNNSTSQHNLGNFSNLLVNPHFETI